ncbi:MAG TPA: metallophosphoesterase, partial [Bacteroidia bacterium]|nr:metallophosphoesterase [Bacteroidia bacterium]
MAAGIMVSFISCSSNNKSSKPRVEFDENNIVLTFAVMSDTHITEETVNGRNEQKFDTALKYYKELTGGNIDLLFFAGDVTNRLSVYNYQLTTFKNIIENNFNVAGGEVEVIICTGNHDSTAGYMGNLIMELLDDYYFRTDIDKESIVKGNRHCVVNSFHFITVEPQNYGGLQEYFNDQAPPVVFSEETLKWLDEVLSKIAAEEPGKPIFLASHAMLHDTVYGSTTQGWYTEDIKTVVSKYPQVITFSGHMHNQLNDERAIMQTEFTSL